MEMKRNSREYWVLAKSLPDVTAGCESRDAIVMRSSDEIWAKFREILGFLNNSLEQRVSHLRNDSYHRHLKVSRDSKKISRDLHFSRKISGRWIRVEE